MNRTKAHMGGSQIAFLPFPGGNPVAHAVIGGAEERAPLDPLMLPGWDRQQAQRARVAIGVSLQRAGIAISGPFPEIADHVVEPVGIGREAADRGASGKAVLGGIDQWKGTLPVICRGPALIIQRGVIERLTRYPATRGIFPLGLAR